MQHVIRLYTDGLTDKRDRNTNGLTDRVDRDTDTQRHRSTATYRKNKRAQKETHKWKKDMHIVFHGGGVKK